MSETKNELIKRFKCNDCGEMKEYVRCKSKRRGSELKFTQPDLLQSFVNELILPSKSVQTPAAPGIILKQGEESKFLKGAEITKYQSGVGKLMHMMQYSRPEIYNLARDLARDMESPTQVHFNAMSRVMKYCVKLLIMV